MTLREYRINNYLLTQKTIMYCICIIPMFKNIYTYYKYKKKILYLPIYYFQFAI